MLESTLKERPRLRRLVAGAARRALAVSGELAPDSRMSGTRPPASPPGAPARFARGLQPTALGDEQGSASRILYERLSEQELLAVEQLLRTHPEADAYLRQAPNDTIRRYVILGFGVWLAAPPVLEKTGLSAVQPPEGVHAMARGPLSAAGGTYEADLVTDALESVGVDVSSLHSALDFGCSSGRVVRVLQTAYPTVDWHACDPNVPAVEWAQAALPAIDFFPSGTEPPLSMETESLDLVYAISIWSHFAPQLGLRWFEEMRRLIRPGGHLVFTSHSFTAVEFYVFGGSRASAQADEIVGAIYRDGWWYAPEFGDQGDWGVVHPEWGSSFLSPEWLLTQLCPRWCVREFAPGRNQRNQDVYVLQRV